MDELIRLSQEMVPTCWPGSEWFKQEKTWHFPTGATLRMRNLERPEDAAAYQGHSFSWVGFDEITSWPTDEAYRKMLATLRSAEPVKYKRIRVTGNPGGPGHSWVKARWIDYAPQGYELKRDPETGMQRVFIPSKVQDNLILLAHDPGYIDRLRGVGSPELVKAWLDGNWDVVQGAYFSEWNSELHVVRPFRPPHSWLRIRGCDWGSARPTAVLWAAVADGSESYLPRGALYIYRELYLASSPNVGLKLTVEQVAQRIREAEIGDEPCQLAVLDPACFATDGGPSIAERFMLAGVRFKPADNRRVGKLGASAGWDLLRNRLVGEDGAPMIYFAATCVNTIRTLPTMQHDPIKPEDMATTGDDHCADCCRYIVASRPWIPAGREPEQALNMDFLWKQREREARQS